MQWNARWARLNGKKGSPPGTPRLLDPTREIFQGRLLGWVLSWFKPGPREAPRLALVERLSLGPRQALFLIEADGTRLLVASSPESGLTFLELEGKGTTLRSDNPASQEQIYLSRGGEPFSMRGMGRSRRS